MPTIYKPKKQQRKYSVDLTRKERQKVYQSVQWQRLRAAYLAEHPLCEDCRQRGKVTAADDVHHVRSFMTATDPGERMRLALDYGNLRALCKVCHQLEHNRRR